MNVLKELLDHMAFNKNANYSDLVKNIQEYVRKEVSPQFLAEIWNDPHAGRPLYVSPSHHVDCSQHDFNTAITGDIASWDNKFQTCFECGAKVQKYVYVGEV